MILSYCNDLIMEVGDVFSFILVQWILFKAIENNHSSSQMLNRLEKRTEIDWSGRM